MVIKLTEIENFNLLSGRAYNHMCLLSLGGQEKKKRKKKKHIGIDIWYSLLGLISLYLSSKTDTRARRRRLPTTLFHSLGLPADHKVHWGKQFLLGTLDQAISTQRQAVASLL